MLNRLNIGERVFWDTDLTTLDPEKHARFIIGRVMMRGTLDDWYEIKRFYGKERIITEMLQIRYLDKVTLSFLSASFGVPKEQFRCYILSQSHPTHWDC